MADNLASFLSPEERARLTRALGVQLPDGRVFRNGVIVSAGDAARSAATSATNAAYDRQTGQYAVRDGQPGFVNPRQAGQNAYDAALNGGVSGQQQNPATPAGPSPYDDMLNRARLIQQGVGRAQSPAAYPQPQAAPAPYNPGGSATFTLPDGQTRQFGGAGGEAFPAPQGFGFPESPASPDQQQTFAAQPQQSAAPAMDLLRPRSADEINRMSPAQRAGLVQFGQEQAQASAAGAQADLERRKTEAEIVAKLRPPAQNLSLGEQTAQARIAARQQQLGRALTDAERAEEFSSVLRSGSQAGDPEDAARVGLLSRDLAGTPEAADQARSLIANVSTLERRLNDGLKTGKLESFKTDVLGVAKSLGIPVDEAALGNRESAQAQFGQFMLEFFAKTKGAITERENALFASLGPQFAKSPAANKELIGLVKERLQLDMDLGKIYRDGLSKGRPLGEIAAQQQERREKYEQKYDERLTAIEQKFGGAPEASPPAAVPSSEAPSAVGRFKIIEIQ